MAASLDKQMHDLANQINAMAAAAWMMLSASGDEARMYPMMSEIEHSMQIMMEMQQIITEHQRAHHERRESA